MTDEHHFGSFTHAELQDEIERAIKAEQERAARITLFWAAAAYLLGVAVGLIA